jgi:hypothetical protein
MAESSIAIKLVTVSYDEGEGVEVDWDGMSAYEAFGLLLKATQCVEDYIDGVGVEVEMDDDDD